MIIPVFTLCLKRSILVSVSLSPPPEKAQSPLIGQRFQVLSICTLGVSAQSLQPGNDCNGTVVTLSTYIQYVIVVTSPPYRSPDGTFKDSF